MYVSKRKYAVVFIEGKSTQSIPELSLGEILGPKQADDWEYIYALRDNLDPVLDLKVGERLQMSFNRDNRDDSTGFIKRIS